LIREAISLAVDRRDLSPDMAHDVMIEMMSGAATSSQMASFMTAMRMKGETEDELVGFASAMREKSAHITSPPNAVDLCGTGGDGSGTFNISTVASFVVAASGIPVAKHGNRSVSSKSGSADLLDALGIPYSLQPSAVQSCLDNTGFAFMFAPIFHASMKNVLGPRREVGIRTFFNLLGPLTNPARVSNQLVGVYDPALVGKMAKVLARLGVDRAMVVHSSGLDEISNIGKTVVAEVDGSRISRAELSPSDFGYDLAERDDLTGNTPVENARIALSVLRGKQSPKSDVVLMNAAAALYVAGAAENLEFALVLAKNSINSGKAESKLRETFAHARACESAYQTAVETEQLLERRLMPDVLRMRYVDLTASLVKKIHALPDGSALLTAIEPSLLSTPNVLSVLSINRLRTVMTTPAPTSSGSRSGTSMEDALSASSLSIICEYKPRSPSSTNLYVPPDPAETAAAYASAGAAAMSVLTEPDFFGGSYETFSQIRSATNLPLLLKDFVVSEAQVDYAARLGADSVLLIAAALTGDAMSSLIRRCVSMKLEPVVEVGSQVDIEKLRSCDARDLVRIVGANSRDLRSLDTDLSHLSALRSMIPQGKLVLAESGVRSTQDIKSLHGFDAVLIGSALMEAEDIDARAREFVSAGKEVD